MKIAESRLKRLLGKRILNRIKVIGEFCTNDGQPCYLVGGTVRDLILNRKQVDIDLITKANLSSINKKISKKWHLEKTIRSQFNTIKVIFRDGFSIDIARARKESYPHPASLPVVEIGSISDDAKRRDFTINTLRMSLSKEDFGKIYDDLDGVSDIKTGIVRVLHDKSFIDDPTRIFRAIRFKKRFSFHLERKTKKLFTEAVNKHMIKELTSQRIRREIFLLLKEEKWDKIALSLSRNSVLRELGIKQIPQGKNLLAFKKNLLNFPTGKSNFQAVKLLVMLEKSTKSEIDSFSKTAGLKNEEIKLLLNLKKNGEKTLKKLAINYLPNSDIYWLLNSIPTEGIVYLYCKSVQKQRQRISIYLDRLKHIKTKITGQDLKLLGIKEGPIYEKILNKILDEKLNGKLKTKREELKFMKNKLMSRNPGHLSFFFPK